MIFSPKVIMPLNKRDGLSLGKYLRKITKDVYRREE
jgi:hypothetical protein